MDTVYSLNTHPFTGAPMKKEEHQSLMKMILVIVVIVGAVIGAILWINLSHSASTAVPVDPQTRVRQQVASLLQSAKVNVSQAEIDSVASVLVKSKTTATNSDRAKVAQELEI